MISASRLNPDSQKGVGGLIGDSFIFPPNDMKKERLETIGDSCLSVLILLLSFLQSTGVDFERN